MARVVSGVLLAGLLTLVPAHSALAQFVSTASIDGLVTDQGGGALPGVVVSLTSPALQVPRLEAVSNSEGIYRFAQLPGGVYQVRFELAGFQSVIRDGLQVGVGFAAKLDMELRIG